MVSEKRLEHAAYYYCKPKKCVPLMYEEIGFENLSSFVQAYKNKFGTTPNNHKLIFELLATFLSFYF
jgi:AraC-like DNA-binding protein